MFFDDANKDQEYENLLREIVSVQRKLLDCRFIWDKRRRIEKPRKKFFRMRQSTEDPLYSSCLAELKELKERTLRHCQNAGYLNGIHWWSIPWEQTEEYLIFDLEILTEHDNWRFEQSWESLPADDMKMLILKEEGHCSIFSSQKVRDSQIVSAYSQSEINSRIRDANNMFSYYELYEMIPENRRVIGAQGIYDSGADYIKSSEYIMEKALYLSNYERDLYKTRDISGIVAQSMSIHYEAAYAVAAYKTDHRRLTGIRPLGFQVYHSAGSLPVEAADFYSTKDSAVALAAYLADEPSVSEIPVPLLIPDITQGAPTFEEARRQAEIFTCLMHKLVF